MQRPNPIRAFITTTALIFSLTQADAAVRTWTGAGADDTWTNAANWGGTAPANADFLVFSGTTQQNNTNNYSALSVNGLSLTGGGFTLNGTNANFLALNGPLTNSA